MCQFLKLVLILLNITQTIDNNETITIHKNSIDIDRISVRNPMVLNQEMRGFAEKIIDKKEMHDLKKFRKLYNRLFFSPDTKFTYDNSRTRTAEEAFREKRGNCVSFSLMFVELARHIGLKAGFQTTKTLVKKRDNQGCLTCFNHMNVTVQIEGRTYIADFDGIRPLQDYCPETFMKITDREAIGIHFSNLAVENLKNGNYSKAIKHSTLAYKLYPVSHQVLTTFGFSNKMRGRLREAETAFLKAIDIDNSIESTYFHLASTYFLGGKVHAAEVTYGKKVEKKSKNPYFLYREALTFKQKGLLMLAKKKLEKAKRYDPGNHIFENELEMIHHQQELIGDHE